MSVFASITWLYSTWILIFHEMNDVLIIYLPLQFNLNAYVPRLIFSYVFL